MTKTSSSHSVPSFIRKIFQMISNTENSTHVSWTSDGKSMLIHNEELFSTEILPRYFKHSNYCSFVRQLNMYSFHKVRESDNLICFSHQAFQRGDSEGLVSIKRKPEKKKSKVEIRSTEGRKETDENRENIQIRVRKCPQRQKPKPTPPLTEKHVRFEITQQSILKQQPLNQNHQRLRKSSVWECNISISGDLGEPSPRKSMFGDLDSPRNYFSPINFDAFICSYSNFLK